MRKILLIGFFFLSYVTLYCQPSPQWSKIYNSAASQDDYFVDMKVDAMGNVYITGYTLVSMQNYDCDIITFKYNSEGVLQWSKTYYSQSPENNYEVPVGIEIDPKGFIYIAGKVYDSINKQDYLLIKYNPNGDTVWTKKYNNSLGLFDELQSFTIDSDGNIFMTGIGGGTTPQSYSGYATIKVDTAGNKIWSRYYKSSGQATDGPRIIKTDGKNNIFVVGGNVLSESVLIKYSNNGDSLWSRFYGPGAAGFNVFFDKSGNVYSCGYKHIIKYDYSGDIIWSKNFRNNCADIQMDKDSNIIRFETVYIAPRTHFSVTKISSAGDSLWGKTFSPVPQSRNTLTSGAIDNNNNIFITGFTDYNTTLWNRFVTLKYSPDSTFQWAAYFNNNNQFTNHEAKKILTDTLGNLYVAGQSTISTGLDISVVKYSTITSINQNSNIIPLKYSLQQNYPNPFNPITIINYELRNTNYVQINIYNALGKEITSLINQKQNTGSYSISFNSNQYNLGSGIYYYSLSLDGEVMQTRKMILLK